DAGAPDADAGPEDAGPPDAGPAEEEPADAGPPPPPRDPLPPPADHLALGAAFACFGHVDGRVACWGSNRFGQLGDPELGLGARARRTEAAYVAGVRARRVEAGSWHACALGEDGGVRCWGHGAWGQLGDGEREDRSAPVEVAGLEDVVQLALGEGHGCARTAERRLHCWGRNHMGQLGDGTTENRLAPVTVPLEEVVDVAAGRAHSCARTADGRVWCWGENLDGQLGDGSRGAPAGHRASPAAVEGVESELHLAAGGGASCAWGDEGAWCWGRNDSWQLRARPAGEPESAVLRPARVHAGPVREVALGGRHTCLLRPVEGEASEGAGGAEAEDDAGAEATDGAATPEPNGVGEAEAAEAEDAREPAEPELEVLCVGLNHRGQLGDGSRRLRRDWVRVERLRRPRELGAGTEFGCARIERGVRCWGDNRSGQLADGTRRFRTAPVPVQGLRFERDAGIEAAR
ncbi:MAG TPA: hypothetical protein RMI62_14245, partial [Polyangiaceae bacterium LLY-WYZ-15_(1-7)]|nr:hypothetical protein [Polyangiaceae bacterium LLY-WYZ-15_(1-7)]